MDGSVDSWPAENCSNFIYKVMFNAVLYNIFLGCNGYITSLKKKTQSFKKFSFDLFTDSEKFVFIENSIGGGISVVSHRHAKANNPLVPDYDHNFPHSYLTYLDANNLDGGDWAKACQ